MRRFLLIPLVVLLAVTTAGCPLDIQVRCEDSSSCRGNEVCVSGTCTPSSSTGDGGTNGGGDGGTDGGCSASVPLDGRCSQDCECSVPGASCPASTCVKECTTDTECPDDWRCSERKPECEFGARLGQRCNEAYDCPWTATCNALRRVCEEICTLDQRCPVGYQCSPDKYCVAKCSAPPATVGTPCSDSMECGCGFCVNTGGVERCRQPCVSDQDCPGGAPGVCERVGSTNKSACKLP